MNIDQYRALKAQMQQDEATPNKEQPTTPTSPEIPPTNSPTNQTKKTPNTQENKDEKNENTIPQTLHLEGIGEITVDELRKGYLRNKDYTQKTQEVSKQRKEVQEAVDFVRQIKENPQLLQQKPSNENPQQKDPLIQKILELESTIYDMKIEKEIEGLQSKYEDVDIVEVLEVAQAKKIMNLEDAYLLSKSNKKPTSSANIDELKEQIRKELMKEIQAESEGTRTIITPGSDGTVYEDNAPKLSEGEKKVAKNMFKNAKDPYAEYARWKNVKA